MSKHGLFLSLSEDYPASEQLLSLYAALQLGLVLYVVVLLPSLALFAHTLSLAQHHRLNLILHRLILPKNTCNLHPEEKVSQKFKIHHHHLRLPLFPDCCPLLSSSLLVLSSLPTI